jgi:hypothetical protein
VRLRARNNQNIITIAGTLYITSPVSTILFVFIYYFLSDKTKQNKSDDDKGDQMI